MKNKPLGKHWMLELYGCAYNSLNNIKHIEENLLLAANEAEATIVETVFHKFNPFGISGVVVIAESHFAIHTWPELGYAAIDLFTCKMDMELDGAVKILLNVFKPKNYTIKEILRGFLDKKLEPQIKESTVNGNHKAL